jgi:hypothetical protein
MEGMELQKIEGRLSGLTTSNEEGGCHNPIFTPGIFSGVGTQNETT